MSLHPDLVRCAMVCCGQLPSRLVPLRCYAAEVEEDAGQQILIWSASTRRSRKPRRAIRVMARFPSPERGQSELVLLHMATFRSASTLISSDGTRTPGTAALFTEPGRKGGTPPWAGDFRPANSAGNGPKNAVGRTFTLELPDGSTGKVVVQRLKSGKGGVVLALMGEDAPPF